MDPFSGGRGRVYMSSDSLCAYKCDTWQWLCLYIRQSSSHHAGDDNTFRIVIESWISPTHRHTHTRRARLVAHFMNNKILTGITTKSTEQTQSPHIKLLSFFVTLNLCIDESNLCKSIYCVCRCPCPCPCPPPLPSDLNEIKQIDTSILGEFLSIWANPFYAKLHSSECE